MIAHCQAQTLPPHIIQRIVEFLLGTKKITFVSRERPAFKNTLLIPLISVCKHWNTIVCGIFYRSALLVYDGVKVTNQNCESLITLDEVVAQGKLGYLRKLQIYISLIDFFSTDNNPAMQLKSFLDACGPLADVNEIALSLDQSRAVLEPSGLLDSGAEEDTFAIKEFEARLLDFVDSLNRLLPNKRVFNVYKNVEYHRKLLNQSLYQKIVDALPGLLGHDIRNFFGFELCMEKPFVTSLQASTLRRITLIRELNSELYVELIRHNCSTLEYIMLSRMDTGTVSNIIGPINDDAAPVYPRLKELHLISCSDYDSIDQRSYPVNPFPALDIFTCQNSYPCILVTILKHIRPYVRILMLNFDKSLVRLFKSHGIFEAGSFKKLECLSLEESYLSRESTSPYATKMLVGALNMSPVAHSIASLGHYVKDVPEDILSNIIFSDDLRSLDIRNTYLTIGQALRLLSGFKNLFRTHLSLREEESTRTLKMPSVNEIEQFRTRFTGYISNVRVIHIENVDFFGSRRAGEYIVLMISAMPSIEHIAISGARIREPLKIVNGIDLALKRPIYKTDGRLKDFTYSIISH